MSTPDRPVPALSIRDLSVRFDTAQGPVQAVDGVSLDVWPGETVGVVGESGCGKTVTMLAALGLLPRPAGRVMAGRVAVDGHDILGLGHKELRHIRGRQVAMIFQDPLTSLHPAQRVIDQVAEAVRAHKPDLSPASARDRAADLLDLVGVADARTRARAYPHEWSGGMRQRAMIAMAVAHRPRVLIADEPTTALDVTVQAQILELLQDIQRDHGLAIVLISHDLGVVAEMADRIVVMYAGRVVEVGDAADVFAHPSHPYTAGLLASLPQLDDDGGRLAAIVGSPPNLATVPPGCPFHPRCALGRDCCTEAMPPLGHVGGGGHRAACYFSEEVAVPASRPDVEMGRR